MKKSRFKQLALSPFRLLLLPTLLISSNHIAKGEVLEFTVNYEEKFDDYTQAAYYTDGWDELATINLKERESLNFQSARFIRQFRIVPENWHYDSRQHPRLKFVFTHDFLKTDFEFKYILF